MTLNLQINEVEYNRMNIAPLTDQIRFLDIVCLKVHQNLGRGDGHISAGVDDGVVQFTGNRFDQSTKADSKDWNRRQIAN